MYDSLLFILIIIYLVITFDKISWPAYLLSDSDRGGWWHLDTALAPSLLISLIYRSSSLNHKNLINPLYFTVIAAENPTGDVRFQLVEFCQLSFKMIIEWEGLMDFSPSKCLMFSVILNSANVVFFFLVRHQEDSFNHNDKEAQHEHTSML